MRIFGAVLVGAAVALLAAPAAAQMQTPKVNLFSDPASKTPEEKEAEQTRDKAYKESLKKIPDAKVSSDPWGGVRSPDAPKTPAAKAAASAKSKAKTGNNPN